MEITGEYVAFSGILIPKNARNRYGLGTLVPYTCVYMQVFYMQYKHHQMWMASSYLPHTISQQFTQGQAVAKLIPCGALQCTLTTILCMEQHALQGLANMQEWCVTQHKHTVLPTHKTITAATQTPIQYLDSSHTQTYTDIHTQTYTDIHTSYLKVPNEVWM